MNDESCLYTLFHAPPEQHDALLVETVAPLVRVFRERPELHSLFVARYNKPDWQLRFRVLGAESWVQGEVRCRIEAALPEAREHGRFTGVEFARYEREWERYGGEVGMPLCEKIFFHDTIACLDVVEAEARGESRRSRREWSLVFVERFLDLMRFDRGARIAFYRFGQSWPFTQGEWHDEETAILERKYRSLRDGLRALFAPEVAARPDDLWGGSAPRAAAEGALARMRPAVDEILTAHREGRLAADLVNLAWSLMHMHCNRLGVDAVAEAILRYYMCRLHEDAGTSAA